MIKQIKIRGSYGARGIDNSFYKDLLNDISANSCKFSLQNNEKLKINCKNKEHFKDFKLQFDVVLGDLNNIYKGL